MELRLYRQTDHEQVMKLHELPIEEAGVYKGDGRRDEDIRDIEAAYFADGGEFWIGEIGGEIVATGAFRRTPGDTAELKRMRVAAERQGLGFGKLMLNKLEERAKELGITLLHLETTEEQGAARKLYESAGYSMHERRVIDGNDCQMYVKWLVPPEPAVEMTPEEEAAFYADWDVSQELTEYAKRLLREGASPVRAMEEVLGSELYAEWSGKERCFNVEYDRLDMYEDLQSSVLSDRRIGYIEEKAAAHFDRETDTESVPDLDAWDEADEPVFAEMKIRIKPSVLAQEMARFSRAVGLGKPIRYVHFLALFSGATIVDMEQGELEQLIANKGRAVELAEAFAERHGDDSSGEV